jgi:cell division protein FtsB
MTTDTPSTSAPAPAASRRPVRRRLTAEEIKRRRSRLTTGALSVAFAVLVINGFVGENGYLATIAAQKERAQLASQIATLRLENQRLQQARERLETDPAALEEAARRQGMIREGETIVTFRAAPATTTPAPSR